MKAHLRAGVRANGGGKILLVRRPERHDPAPLRLFVGRPREGGSELHTLEIGGYDEILDLDLTSRMQPWRPVEHPLLLVCTHGKHDPCCARYGRPLCAALHEQADPDWVWQTSHVGGDRFAGNVVCPREGLYYGRVSIEDAFDLLDDHLAGRVHLPRYRGRALYPFAAQAAEVALRERHGIGGIDDLRLLGLETTGPASFARFAWAGGELRATIHERPGPLTHLTCGDRRLKHPPRFEVAAT